MLNKFRLQRQKGESEAALNLENVTYTNKVSRTDQNQKWQKLLFTDAKSKGAFTIFSSIITESRGSEMQK